MSIIICGIPKEGDDFVCPHCGYRSSDIENFATSMCWSCVFGINDQEPTPEEPEYIEDEYEESQAGFATEEPPPWWS